MRVEPHFSVDADSLRAAFIAVEHEHQEVGQSIHDTFSQTLSGAVLMANLLARRVHVGGGIAASEMEELSRTLDRALGELRVLSQRLVPAQGGPQGPMAALQNLALATAREGLACDFVCEEPVLIADAPTSLALCRIAQSAVRQAIERAHVSQIRIHLDAQSDQVILTVSDNGEPNVIAERSNEEPDDGVFLRALAFSISIQRRYHPEIGNIVECVWPAAENVAHH